ncbi:DUF4255 domain-containing protein [Phosphitispora fastidiosa]|uniref:DUF4255 domain-containing protein n=1 Tax=Phosphitispora fastidiosa TaxID=2837202 RepID=UPI001E33E84E|nr:DUF4255 domain-containing protein [Phosphitispora fastidiosa]MBU7005783.1 hypothetical protein [Phosphitispora fastidiosa]
MGDYTVIADVGETLIKLLRDNMSDLVNPDSIDLLSPADVEGHSIRLTLFLYSVSENAYLKNREVLQEHLSGLRQPPLTVDLYYILTTYAANQIPDLTERTLEEHRILGRAMRVLYDNPILRGSVLQGNLTGVDEEFRITLNSLSMEELNKIWTSFPTSHYHPSVGYLVTPVAIDSARTVETQRVVVQKTEYYKTETRK